ncbi:hypothetical protein KGY77_11160 [Candidatus Bipolaricaulota bacterium]|nr:hypothetical protein [Candidatus Bipolaricaulota bacterium]MBS3793186.1 hypothetical protein [Candidatus Bipolaricaulota bacterium]
MEVEFRVNSDHLTWDDPGIEAAVEEYTNPFWPFGRREKAQRALEEKQNKLLEKHGIEEDSQLGVTILKVDGVQSEDEAWEKVRSFKEDLDDYYQNELDLDEPLEVAVRERTTV